MTIGNTPNSNRKYRCSAAAASSMKLKTIYDGSHSQGNTGYITRGYQAMIWSTVEHGLSIFASSLLALRPLMRLVPKGWTTLLGAFHSRGRANSSRQGSSRQKRRSNWINTAEWNELGSVGAKNSVSLRSEYEVDGQA